MENEQTETTTNNQTSEQAPEKKPSDGGKSFVEQALEEGSNAGDQGGDGKEGAKAEGEGKGEDKKASSDEGKPESYADLKIPDGYSLEGPERESAVGIFQELNLTPEGAQKLVDWYIERDKRLAEEADARIASQSKEWEKAIDEHEVLGGRNKKSTMAQVARTISAFDVDGSFTEMLKTYGLGNHPAVVQMLAVIGSMIKEDSGGSGRDAGEGNPLRALYPTMFE